MVLNYETVDSFAKFLSTVIKSDRDAMIVVSGFTGEGKSTFTIQLGLALAKCLKSKFTFKDNMTYVRDEMVEMIDGENQLPEYSVLLVDEAVSLFNRRNWMKKGQKSALELLDKCRDRHLVMICNVPSFWALDNMLINNKARFWIHVHKRGYAWVFTPIKNPFTQDKWQRDRNEKKFAMGGITALARGKNSNLMGKIEFKDLEPKLKKEYLKVRNEKSKDTEAQDEKSEMQPKVRKQKAKLVRALVNEHSWKQKDVAKLIGDAPQTISSIINAK